MQDNLLWQYSLAIYQRQQIASVLLRLQDEFSADINLLLCCCWLGEKGLQTSAPVLSELISAVEGWRRQCVEPLRSVRRFVKQEAAMENLYQQLKNLELQAERKQQDMLVEVLDSLGFCVIQSEGEPCIGKNLHAYMSLLTADHNQQLLQLVTELEMMIGC